MKKRTLLALAGIFYLAGCQALDSDAIKTGEKQYPIRFSLQLKEEIVSFPSVRSIPDLSIPDPIKTNKSPEAGDNLFSKIEYIVYDNSENPEKFIRHKQFTSADDDFTIIYDSLPAGNYKIAFLAHSSEVVELSGNMFKSDQVSDAFHICEIISVGTNDINKSIELKRVVSRIEFVSEEMVPATLKSFDIEVKPYFNQINIFTGEGATQTNTYTFPHLFTDEEKGTNNFTHNFYTFIPSGNQTISATLIATGNDESQHKREVGNITPVINKIIRYKGKLYSPKSPEETFSLSVINNGAWDQPDNDIPLE